MTTFLTPAELASPLHAAPARTPTTTRLTASIGAVVEGLDLRRLDAGTGAWLRRAVIDHRVVFVRQQDLGEADLRGLAAGFGPLARSPLHQLLGTDRTTSVIEDDADRPPAGFDWHTDLSWTSAPPAFGFLHALDIPAYGGDTIWASQVAAFDSLGSAARRRCLGLWVEHACDASLLATVERHHGAQVAAALGRANPPVVHPLVRRHTESGEAGLFLSPMYQRRLVGPSRADGDRTLRRLERALLDPHHQVRWRWNRGDVAIWDETTTCHRALTDHFPQRRRMARCVVAGTTPVPAGDVPPPRRALAAAPGGGAVSS